MNISTDTMMSKIGYIFLSWRRHLQKRIQPAGCTLKQHHVLRKLSRDGFLTPSQIADELFCDRPTASVIIANLYKYGWIKKEADPDNRRTYRISITGAGMAKLEETSHSLLTDQNPLKDLSNKEQEQLYTLLQKVQNNFEQIL